MYRCRNCNCNIQSNSTPVISSNNASGCGFNDPPVFPNNYMYGQSYVPIQYISKTFKPDAGLKMGTIFPELVSPYSPGQSMEEIQYITNSSITNQSLNTGGIS